MKRIVAILLLFCFTMQCFSQFTIFVGFELNRHYIAQHLCVNRDNPEMNCHGQCFLEKKLHQDHDRQSQENENTGDRIAFYLFCPDKPYTIAAPIKSNTQLFDNSERKYLYTPLFGFFHPPRISAA